MRDSTLSNELDKKNILEESPKESPKENVETDAATAELDKKIMAEVDAMMRKQYVDSWLNPTHPSDQKRLAHKLALQWSDKHGPNPQTLEEKRAAYIRTLEQEFDEELALIESEAAILEKYTNDNLVLEPVGRRPWESEESRAAREKREHAQNRQLFKNHHKKEALLLALREKIRAGISEPNREALDKEEQAQRDMHYFFKSRLIERDQELRKIVQLKQKKWFSHTPLTASDSVKSNVEDKAKFYRSLLLSTELQKPREPKIFTVKQLDQKKVDIALAQQASKEASEANRLKTEEDKKERSGIRICKLFRR